MCGITGWLFTPGSEPAFNVLEQMAIKIRHRGPDDQGFYHDSIVGLGLAHRRLSIIDLSNASHQPMVDESHNIVLVYNGELYNFLSLRQELQARGHVFHSQGDTEVILRSYIEWGITCFERFAGMFAIALWDGNSGTLHLARDPLGMKPLYYVQSKTGLAFASEVKSLLQFPATKAELDPQGIQQYLEFGYVFDERKTLIKGIKKVAPGQRLEIRNGKICYEYFYFTPPSPDLSDKRSENDRLDELGAVLENVVKEHLIADVPVGLLLSGGLDSSLIAALAARHKEQLNTISMGFADSNVDERPQARLVSEYIGSKHQEFLLTPKQIKQEVMDGIWVFDDLFADWGTISTRLLYRHCRELGVKVVLVGEGSDELFGGYDIFQVPQPLSLWQQFRLYQQYSGRRYGKLFGQFRHAMSEYLEAGNDDAFHAVRLFESRRQLPNNYVMKVDKASMAESIEARAPFLDRRVAEIAYRTPKDWLLRNGENKYLLRAYAKREKLLPNIISERPKFGAPLAASWMDDDIGFRHFTQELLLDSNSQTSKLGLKNAMSDYFLKGKAGYSLPSSLSIFRNLAWRLLLLELWSQHYLKTA